MRRVGILTVSDRAAAGTYADESGPLAAAILGEQTAWRVERQAVIPDDLETIARTLRDWCEANLDLIPVSYTHLDVYKRQEQYA